MEFSQKTVENIPFCTINASPRDELWSNRLKEEVKTLISYIKSTKESETDWFYIKPINKQGTQWKGYCWFIYEMKKYQFNLEFELPVSYPHTPFEILLPELEGKTAKMYRGGKICLSLHFKPLWSQNVPHFGIAHALVMGLAPWLASEIPDLVAKELIQEVTI